MRDVQAMKSVDATPLNSARSMKSLATSEEAEDRPLLSRNDAVLAPPPAAVPNRSRDPSAHSDDEDIPLGADGQPLDICQMVAPIFYVDEGEDLELDVMRLGSLKGRCSVVYETFDGTAKAGAQFTPKKGVIVFEEGEHLKSVSVSIAKSQEWATTLEFTIRLSEPDTCVLGHVLHRCRVKIIDSDLFPSSKYKDDLVLGTEEGIESIGNFGLFLEYFKLIMSADKIGLYTVMIVIFDQMQSVYVAVQLYITIYLADVLFSNEEFEETEVKLTFGPRGGRTYTAMVIGVLYIAPMFLLHFWDYFKTRLNVYGLANVFIKKNLFNRYLNYTEGSRAHVPASVMQSAIIHETREISEGYAATLKMFQVFGKLMVLIGFVCTENPGALRYVSAMPVMMLFWVWARNKVLVETMEFEVSKFVELLNVVHETCMHYRVIADYKQRPRMNALFERANNANQDAHVAMSGVVVNNDYFARWLGPFFIGLYIVMAADWVFDGMCSLGTFLATIRIFHELSVEFTEAYAELMKISKAMAPLRQLTFLFNKEEEVGLWKHVVRRNKSTTAARRAELLCEENCDGTRFKCDGIELALLGVAFNYENKRFDNEHPTEAITRVSLDGRNDSSMSLFGGISSSVPQGGIVCIDGPHKSGKETLMRLVGHSLIPNSGEVFVPAHLRTLYVSQEPVLLHLSVWDNLTFGNVDVTIEFVEGVLKGLEMWSSYSLMKDELSKAGGITEMKIQESRWQESLSYSERAKLHLARALIMNPEVLVLQRPLSHYDEQTGLKIWKVIREHVDNRGYKLPKGRKCVRRPRSLFFSPTTRQELKFVDTVWEVIREGDQQTLLVHRNRSHPEVCGSHGNNA